MSKYRVGENDNRSFFERSTICGGGVSAERSSDPCDMMRSSDTVRSSDTIKSTDTVISSDMVRSSDMVGISDLVRSSDMVRSIDTMKTTDTVNSTDKVKSTDMVKSKDNMRSSRHIVRYGSRLTVSTEGGSSRCSSVTAIQKRDKEKRTNRQNMVCNSGVRKIRTDRTTRLLIVILCLFFISEFPQVKLDT